MRTTVAWHLPLSHLPFLVGTGLKDSLKAEGQVLGGLSSDEGQVCFGGGGKVGVVNPQVALGPRLLAPWVPRQLPEGRLCLLL